MKAGGPETLHGHSSVRYRRKALPLNVVRKVLRREQGRIYELYAALFHPDAGLRILDLGVNGSLDRREQHFFEFRYPHRERIVAAGLEPAELFRSCYPEVHYVQVGRDRPLPFADGLFDVVFCSAVLEHAGSRARQRILLREIARVGRAAFVTTPNRWYPIELHTMLPFVHYLPTRAYRAILRGLGFGFFAAEENLNLLDRAELGQLLPPGVDAWLFRHRFLGPVSNLILVWGAEPNSGAQVRAARRAARVSRVGGDSFAS